MLEVLGVRWRVYEDENGWSYVIEDDRFDVELASCESYSDEASCVAAVQDSLEELALIPWKGRARGLPS